MQWCVRSYEYVWYKLFWSLGSKSWGKVKKKMDELSIGAVKLCNWCNLESSKKEPFYEMKKTKEIKTTYEIFLKKILFL